MRPIHYDYIVLGAGISGLTLAVELQSKGKTVLVLEANPHVGGVLTSMVKDGMVWDRAAHTIAADVEVLDFFKKHDLEELIEKPSGASGTRQLVIGEKIYNVESHPLKIIKSRFLSVNAKLSIIRAIFRKSIGLTNPTVKEFFQYHLGEEITRNIISAVFSGIYAGDIAKMEMKSVMGKIFKMEQEKGSLIKVMSSLKKEGGGRSIIGIKGGTQKLLERLAGKLEHLRTGERVISYKIDTEKTFVETDLGAYSCGKLISTIPAYSLAPLVKEHSERLAELLDSIEYASLALLHLAFSKNESASDPAFGFLCSQYADTNLKGAIYNSQIFPSRSSEMETFTIFMKYDAGMDFELEKRKVVEEFMNLKGIKVKPEILEHTIWKRGIPQFNKPYLSRKENILKLADLDLSGSFISGVSVTDCIKFNVALAEKLTS